MSLVSSFIALKSCLFSSQLLSLPCPKASWKFVEVHQECLKHNRLHDIRLGESIFLTAFPGNRLFLPTYGVDRSKDFFGCENCSDPEDTVYDHWPNHFFLDTTFQVDGHPKLVPVMCVWEFVRQNS